MFLSLPPFPLLPLSHPSLSPPIPSLPSFPLPLFSSQLQPAFGAVGKYSFRRCSFPIVLIVLQTWTAAINRTSLSLCHTQCHLLTCVYKKQQALDNGYKESLLCCFQLAFFRFTYARLSLCLIVSFHSLDLSLAAIILS